MRWAAATLKHVMTANETVCNDWPETDDPWMQHARNAIGYLERQVIPDDVLPGTRALLRQSLPQNAGIYRRQAIEALVAGGWTGPVARALEKFLELESERLTGTLRREVLDRTLILNQAHMRAVLAEYQEHYNTARPHQGIGQRVPDHGPGPRVTAADPGTWQIRRKPVLSGLINEYEQAA